LKLPLARRSKRCRNSASSSGELRSDLVGESSDLVSPFVPHRTIRCSAADSVGASPNREGKIQEVIGVFGRLAHASSHRSAIEPGSDRPATRRFGVRPPSCIPIIAAEPARVALSQCRVLIAEIRKHDRDARSVENAVDHQDERSPKIESWQSIPFESSGGVQRTSTKKGRARTRFQI
jgi:hypothetical protein